MLGELLGEAAMGAPGGGKGGMCGSGGEGGLLVFGGNPQNAGEQRCDVWVLRASDMVWSELSPSGNAPGPRAYHTADRVGGLIIIHGGRSPQGTTGDVHVLDTVALAWHSVYVDARAILPRPLNNAAMKKAGLATSNTSNTSGGAVMNTIAKRAWHSSQVVPFAATGHGGHGEAVAGGVEGAGGDAAGGGARSPPGDGAGLRLGLPGGLRVAAAPVGLAAALVALEAAGDRTAIEATWGSIAGRLSSSP